MLFPERTEKMVVDTDDHNVASCRRIDRSWKRFSRRPLHLHPLLEASMTISKKTEELRQLETITILAASLLLLNAFSPRQLFANTALALLLIGLFVRPVARLISWVWLRFSEILGAFNSRIILSLLFFLFLTPLSIIFRLFAKNPLLLKRTESSESLFLERNHKYARHDFEKMW